MIPGEDVATAQLPKNRDDFALSVKEMLSKRVRHECSNPDCRKPTSGPQEDPLKAINIGVAAHISAASPSGPRFDGSLSAEARAGIDNGIWLCQNCGKLVDNDPVRYPVGLLRSWKTLAEHRAARALEESRAPDHIEDDKVSRLEGLMPELFKEMRDDLKGHALCREFIILPKGVSFWYPNDRMIFTYFVEDHQDIGNKLRILQNYGLISDIRHNDVPRFAFQEEFAEYLLR
jgi:hypothetical protein